MLFNAFCIIISNRIQNSSKGTDITKSTNTNQHYSYTLAKDGKTVHIYTHILDNEILDITKDVINAFKYQENKSNDTLISQDKYSKKLVPFYDEMIKNAVNRMWGSNNMKLDLPNHPEKTIKEFNESTDINHFYALKLHSLLAYLVPRYWKHMQKEVGIAPSRLAYDLYQIPLNSSSTVNYFVFRGTHRGSGYVPNQFLFGGDMHDSKFFGIKNFVDWANKFLEKHPIDELKKDGIQFIKKG